ncbi:ABC transporter substrate-binding protein [Glaciimonas sp. CA11.2]|uniref:ABC transporter substrate-binding protein n=1 Tax=unclassified Glaciimonas TaxID=2644401 RepID=UPI002AB40E5A|nr:MULTISPECIES: ABC transporter substrate-binding protein [unclassified Glaciimonas]MDY7544932.1 ABC transporter substrate-binding protein [Glaciimonas sp. CA11.2]MEB0013235.1 ABC transporter substrate-binding protein [Glaciimonas sp. Cout2]MEB0082524.1 ABC transporter substrate-binding protein [Glaciimonas sp. Gout2]MEB0163043.1 ABC transporter substrate-binding protein [Glaciimonas sp. CA11.2]
MKFNWKQFGVALCLFLAGYFTFNSKLFAQTLEKPKVSIAVGGKNLFYYLPLTVADQLGYFKDEGLQVEISDFAGGAKALQALIGGSADVVSGAFEHTISMQAKNQMITAFVLQGRAPQIVMAVSNKTMPNYKSIADLKGKKIGVTAPGSSTSMMSNFVLAKGGLKPTDVSYIGVGASAGALSALRSGQIDAIANLDPLITMLQQKNEIRIISDTRTIKETEAVFGGPMPAATLYASADFIKKYPNTTQALTNAMVRALRWLQKAAPEDIVKAVPENYLLGDRALYIEAFTKVREAISPDGKFPDAGAATALRTLESFDPTLADKKIDLSKTYTNAFVTKADLKFK